MKTNTMKKKSTAKIISLLLLSALLLAGCGGGAAAEEGGKTANEGATVIAASENVTAASAGNTIAAASENAANTASENTTASASDETAGQSSTDAGSHQETASTKEEGTEEAAEVMHTSTGQADLSADQGLTDREPQNEMEHEVRSWMDSVRDAWKNEDTEALRALFDPIYTVDDLYQNAWELQKLNDDYTVEGKEKEEGIVVHLQGTLKETGEESGVYLSFYRNDGRLVFDYRIINDHLCGSCGGAGQIYHGGQACAICGGTGQVWVDNVYYDGIQWQGQWQACGGCGGMGYTDAESEMCGVCGGTGLNW